jgi:hypothetical protein
MRKIFLIGTLSVVAVAILAVTALGAAPTRKAALVRFMKPTIIAGAAVLGPVVFEHDDERMANGGACTRVFQYDVKTQGLGNLLVEFHCTPKEREVVKEFEAKCIKAPLGPDRLVEYQFKGETEGHAVPY